MPSCSPYLAKKLLDHVFGKTTFTADDDLEIGFYSEAPDSEGAGGTELTGDGYDRVAIDNSNAAAFWAAATGRGEKLNDETIDLPQADDDWLAIVAWKIFDSSGNLYTFGRTTAPILVKLGESRKIPVGSLIQNLT